MIVSTFDGKLTSLEFDGRQWIESWSRSFDDRPLLSSTIQNVRIFMRGMPYRMIPALDGSLYTFNGRFIAQLPLTADSLLKSSHKIGDDVLAAGRSESTSFGIRAHDGQLVYNCSADGCLRYPENESSGEPVLVVQRLSHGVRALDPRTGREKWNMFTTEFRVSLPAEVPDCHSGPRDHLLLEEEEDDESVMLGLANSELVFISGANGTIRSKKKFESPIAAAWIVLNGKISPIDPFAGSEHSDDLTGIYIGQAGGQLYIQSAVNRTPGLQVVEVPSPHAAAAHIAFKPSKSTRPATTGTALSVIENEELELSSGFIYHQKCDAFEHESEDVKGNTSFDDFSEDEDLNTIDQMIVVSLWFWWKEILAISLTLAVVLNIVAHYLKKQVKECMDCETTSDESHTSDQRTSGSRSRSKSQNLTETESESRALYSTPSPAVMERPFISRFESDYENIQCRGRGGFGVVFEARKKLESVSYAVKRIRMPSKPELQEKVMREVKALANMHHQNIVRYYTSWTEEPPIGWQEEFDKRIRSSHNKDFSITTMDSNKSSVVSSISVFSDQAPNQVNGHRKFIDSISEEDSLRVARDEGHTSHDSYVVFQDTGNDAPDESKVQGKEKTEESQVEEVTRRRNRRSVGPKTFLYIQMELCVKQTLREWLQENNTSSLRDRPHVLSIFRQIVEAVDYVHSSGLMHRDLKPSNIFFSSDGAVKVGDFGLVTAAAVESGIQSSPETGSSSPPDSLTMMTGSGSSSGVNHTDNVGTFLYMSPDQLGGISYSNKVDIYSLGVILYEMLIPFRTEMERLHTLKHVRELSFPQSFCKKFEGEAVLLKQMLAVNPNERPSATEILGHKMLAENKGLESNGGRRRRTISITDSGDQT